MKKLIDYLFDVQPLTMAERRAMIERKNERYGTRCVSVTRYQQPTAIADKLQQLMRPLTLNNA